VTSPCLIRAQIVFDLIGMDFDQEFDECRDEFSPRFGTAIMKRITWLIPFQMEQKLSRLS
jgi:hypothetical protein